MTTVPSVMEAQYVFSQERTERVYKRVAAMPCGALLLCVLAPLGVCTVLWAVVLGVSNLVFVIQALVVGSATYQNKCGPTAYVGQWMIIWGSLGLGSCCLQQCQSKDEEGRAKDNIISVIGKLAGLTGFAILCWGMNIVYTQGNAVYKCSPSQYNVFVIMVNYMLWGSVALLAAASVLMCVFLPIGVMFVEDVEKEGKKQEASKPAAGAGAAPAAAAADVEAPPPAAAAAPAPTQAITTT